MNRLASRSFLGAATLAALAALAACGGISDPTKGGSASEHVATVTGSLTGANVPAGAHVALIWRVGTTDAFEVAGDVAVVGGKFTMDLGIPSSTYFFAASDELKSSSQSGSSEGSAPVANPPSGTEGGSSGSGSTEGADASTGITPGSSTSSSGNGGMWGGSANIQPRDTVSGGIAGDLNVAVAGFVVYVDSNGNGKLDISGNYAASTDEIIGGSSDLTLAYLKDGGALDYEKLRDKAGVAPAEGYNLLWSQGERWLPLNLVELKLNADTRLPSPVCQGGGAADETVSAPPRTTDSPPSSSSSSSGSSGTGTGTPTTMDGGAPTPVYPSPDDPNLHCSPDGTSFYYEFPSTPCPAPAPAPQGLCAPQVSTDIACVGSGGGGGDSIPPGTAPPPGWPCPVAFAAEDAGAPNVDAGQ